MTRSATSLCSRQAQFPASSPSLASPSGGSAVTDFFIQGMKPKNTLILLILAIGLFAFIRFYESKTLGTKEAAEEAKRVFNLDMSAIDGISINSNENKIELHK